MAEKKNISSIQCLRAIAAILVVFSHSEQFVSAFLPVRMMKNQAHTFGNFGVDIFFVISGFIMVYISQDHFGQKGASRSFLKRRFIRIFPIYWLISLIVFFILMPSGLYVYAFHNSAATDINEMKSSYYVIKSFLLLPYFNMLGKQVLPIVSVGWTLIYEIFFYLIFAIILFFNRKNYLAILGIIFTLMVMTMYLFNNPLFHLKLNSTVNLYLTLYGNPVIFEFFFGCIVAELYLRGKLLSNTISVLAILFSGFSFYMYDHIPRLHYYQLHDITLLTLYYHISLLGVGVSSMLLVYGLLSLESNNTVRFPFFLVKLGDASYSIYLTHFSISLLLLLSLLKKTEQFIHMPGDLAVFVLWAMCIPLGYATYQYVESPLLKFFHRLNFKKIALLTVPNNVETSKKL